MEVHGMKNGVLCCQDVFPAYQDVVAATGCKISYEEWIKAQPLCNMCEEGIDGPCPHGPEDPREDN